MMVSMVVFLLFLLVVSGTSESLTLYAVFSDSERYNSSDAIAGVEEAVTDFRHLLSEFTVDIIQLDTKVHMLVLNNSKLLGNSVMHREQFKGLFSMWLIQFLLWLLLVEDVH